MDCVQVSSVTPAGVHRIVTLLSMIVIGRGQKN